MNLKFGRRYRSSISLLYNGEISQSVSECVCLYLPFFDLNQIGHNSVNFQATASRFCMEEDVEEEDEVEEVDDDDDDNDDDDNTSKNVFFAFYFFCIFCLFCIFCIFCIFYIFCIF